MPYTVSAANIKAAFSSTADTLIGLGEQVTYHFHDGTSDKTLNVRKVKLREEELVGDYEQGDLRFFISPTDLQKAPEKYDSITDVEGVTYTLIDYLSCARGIDGTVILYSPVGRG